MSEVEENIDEEIKAELQKQETVQEAEITADQIEEIARQQGWSPDKGEKTALEFLADGREYRDRLYKKVEKLEKDNEKAYQVIADYISTQKEKDHKQEQSSIEEQIRQATEDGDAEKVLQLSKKLNEKPPEKADPNAQYTEQWTTENKWFHENPEMREDALGFYQAEMIKLGRDDPKTILPKVEERIKKVHSTYFNPENPNKNRGAGVERGGKQKSKSDGLSMEELTEDERRHVKDFVAMGMDEKKIMRSIENARKRHQ